MFALRLQSADLPLDSGEAVAHVPAAPETEDEVADAADDAGEDDDVHREDDEEDDEFRATGNLEGSHGPTFVPTDKKAGYRTNAERSLWSPDAIVDFRRRSVVETGRWSATPPRAASNVSALAPSSSKAFRTASRTCQTPTGPQ